MKLLMITNKNEVLVMIFLKPQEKIHQAFEYYKGYKKDLS